MSKLLPSPIPGLGWGAGMELGDEFISLAMGLSGDLVSLGMWRHVVSLGMWRHLGD